MPTPSSSASNNSSSNTEPPERFASCSNWKGRIISMDKYVIAFSTVLLVTGIVMLTLNALKVYELYLPGVVSSSIGGSLFFCGLITYCCACKDILSKSLNSDDKDITLSKPKTKTPTNPDNLSVKAYLESKGVFGVPQELIDLMEVVKQKKDGKLIEYNLKLDAGILLHGKTGTGKTTIAKHISHAIGCPEEDIYTFSPGDFKEKYIGESEKKITRAFTVRPDEFRIVILEEVDGITRDRNSTFSDHEAKLVSHLLAKIDGIQENAQILIIATTNLQNRLDEAFKRRGRAGKHFEIKSPDFETRKKMFAYHLKGEKFEKNIPIDQLANKSEGFSNADIVGMITDATLKSLTRKSSTISAEDFNLKIDTTDDDLYSN